MAKVKIKNLPDGFEIQNGKVVKMQKGGSTGDQAGYGLKTLMSDKQEGPEDTSVRFSLSAVPRDKANIEAEGGETVLADLNNDGHFGLYDIKGPRHSKGGVPLFLPEQSFVFSDTPALKMGGEDLEPYGIKTRKKVTPADVSKKFQLNPFYAAIQDPYADEIQVKSAELMMDKNKKKLSRLAFDQERSKDFSEGVPLAAHPFLVSQGIDPIAFTQQVENISQQKAEAKLMASLPPEEQQKLMFLKQMVAAQEQQAQAQAEQQTAEQADIEFAQDFPSGEEDMLMAKFGREMAMYQPGGEKPTKDRGPKKNVAYDPATIEYYKKLGIDVNTLGIGESKYVDMQPQEEGYTDGVVYGDASKNLEGFKQAWQGIYPDLDNLMNAIKNQKGKDPNPTVKKFQKWLNEEYIPSKVNEIKVDVEKNGTKLTDAEVESLKQSLYKDYGFNPKTTGRDFDGDMGTFTSSRRPIGYTPKEKPEPPVETPPGTPPVKKIEVPELKRPRKQPNPNFWIQDLLQLDAISQRDRDMFFPWQPEVENVEVGYVLEEPTRAIAAINEQLNIANQAAGAFGGAQQLAARTAQNAAAAADNIADEIARVNQRNVSTVNQGKAQQAQMDYTVSRERRDRNVKEYDDTQKVLQTYMDEKNFDREQYAQALGNAITNRANTYNLNSIQDYYQIDPTTGGMIGQFNSKAFEPAPLPDPMANIKDYAEAARLLKAAGIEPKAELIQGMLGQPTTPQETNIQRAYRGAPAGMGYNFYPGTYMPKQGSAKSGKEIKKYAVPFYIGKTGI